MFYCYNSPGIRINFGVYKISVNPNKYYSTEDVHCLCPHEIWSRHSFSKKWAILGLFFVLYLSFQTNITIITTNKCEKCPSSIQCWDSNPRLLEHESPITTRPGLYLDENLPRVKREDLKIALNCILIEMKWNSSFDDIFQSAQIDLSHACKGTRYLITTVLKKLLVRKRFAFSFTHISSTFVPTFFSLKTHPKRSH